MPQLFDAHHSSYSQEVADSIRFSGLKHDFFLKAKADLIRKLVIERGLRADGSKVSAVDIGCGIGSLHKHLGGAFDTLTGCDVSSHSIDRARRDNPHNAYNVCTSSQLPFADGALDLALAVCVVHHVPFDSWLEFLQEMHRVVRPGGVACIIEHNPLNPLTRLAVFRCPFDADAVLLSAKTAKGLFRSAGFKEIETEQIGRASCRERVL